MYHTISHLAPQGLSCAPRHFRPLIRPEKEAIRAFWKDLYCCCVTILDGVRNYLFDNLSPLHLQCRLILLGDNNTRGFLKSILTREEEPMPGEETRDRLLQSGIELFGKHGFMGVSLNRLARAAKTSPSSISHFFVSKEGLLEAVVNGAWREINDEVAIALSTANSTITKCERVVETVLNFLESHPEKERILLLEAKHLGELEGLLPAGSEEYRFKETLDRILQEGKQEGTFPRHLSVPAVREGLLGLLGGMLVGRFDKKHGQPPEKYSNKAIMDIVRWSIRGLVVEPARTGGKS